MNWKQYAVVWFGAIVMASIVAYDTLPFGKVESLKFGLLAFFGSATLFFLMVSLERSRNVALKNKG